MATSNVSPAVEVESGIYSGKVSTKVIHPVDQVEVKVTGDFKLPLASDLNEALTMVGGNDSDVVFWFNYGRKMQARIQVGQSLGMDLGSDELNELLKSFNTAMGSFGTNLSDARKNKIKDFILSEEKFAPLRDLMDTWTPEHKSVDFSSVELKKPSGKRGPKSKSEDEE